MTRKEKWMEYRRILRVLRSTCWDCDRACSECQLWAREEAFGRPHKGWCADACSDSYRASMTMQQRGTMILIEIKP